MLEEKMKELIGKISSATVASASSSGTPHLAIGRDLHLRDHNLLEFENWFCPTTLRNVARNPRIAVALIHPESHQGFQLLGTVEQTNIAALMDGYVPDAAHVSVPQVLTRLVIRIDTVMEIKAGVHSDDPLS